MLQTDNRKKSLLIQQGQGILKNELSYPRWFQILFMLFAIYLVMPLVDVPLLGLSLSALFFMVLGLYCILKPPAPWFYKYRGWIFLAAAIWIGIFLSAFLNGIVSGGFNIDITGILTVIRYAYWLLVFVVCAYYFSQGTHIKIVTGVLGWSVLVLGLLRWGEVVILGNVGAWSGTYLFTQNSYGFLFSTFSPFLLYLVFAEKGIRCILALIGYILLLGAVAINGSRGSWVAIGIGIGVLLLFLLFTCFKAFLKVVVFIILIAGLLVLAANIFPKATDKVLARYGTMENLQEDKSYMIRQAMIQKALILFKESPIIGVGASRFTKTFAELELSGVLSYGRLDKFNTKSSHNSYMAFLAECGLIGAVPYAILLAVLSIDGLLRSFQGAKKGEYQNLAVLLSFLQMSLHMWAISTLANTANWFIYGLVTAIIMTKHDQKIQNRTYQFANNR